MRIISSYSERLWTPLEAYKAGTPIRFKCPFHDKHRPDDLFIVNAVCSSYRPDHQSHHAKYRGKICVTNLRSGEIAYLDPQRECTSVQAIVRLEEDGC